MPDNQAEDREQTVVWLGNRNTIEVLDDPDDIEAAQAEQRAPRKIRRPAGAPVKRCTAITLAPGLKLLEAAYDLTLPGRGIWQGHSDDPAPAWVASTDRALAEVLAAHWGCPVRDPEPDHVPSGDQAGDAGSEA